jgi:hypothetical protein
MIRHAASNSIYGAALWPEQLPVHNLTDKTHKRLQIDHKFQRNATETYASTLHGDVRYGRWRRLAPKQLSACFQNS